MRKLVVLGLLFVNSIAFTGASSVKAAGVSVSPVRRTETITLSKAPPDFILQVLGVDKDGSPVDPQTLSTRGVRGLKLPGAPLLPAQGLAPDVTYEVPAGVGSIMRGKGNSLIIRGTSSAIAQLKPTIGLLDFKPKRVSTKVEFIELTAESVKEYFPGDKLADAARTAFSEADIKALKSGVFKGAPTINAPTRTAYNNCSAEFAINLETGAELKDTNDINSAAAMVFRPRVNGDGSVTNAFTATVTMVGAAVTVREDGTEGPVNVPRQMSITTTRRCQSGESLITLFDGYKQEGGVLMMVVTSTVL